MKLTIPIKLSLFLLLNFTFVAYGQFTDPERDTKWNLGFNMGGVWQDGDVQLDRPGFGYGFTLGKGIYESQGKFWSLDLRFRYLKGTTFGQNLSLTDSASIDDNSIYAQNPTNYKVNKGLLYLNTETALHDFSFEAVINFHALREKTGVLLSVFGGVGITDYRTKTDLLYTPEGQNFDEMYDFSSIDSLNATKSDFRNLQDGDYESFAPFSEDKTVKFMPSLGIGLGYQFSPQWSVGFEHRVTFTLQDKFDGLERAGTQFLQWGDHDKYHYSSVFLRWNIFKEEESTSTSTSRRCPPPYLKIVDLPEVYEVNEQLFEIKARVSKIRSGNDVLLVANDQIEQTIYNRNTDYVVGKVYLNEGRNKVYFLATNECGETMDSVIIIYNPDFCPKAEITFLQPVSDTVSTKSIDLKAKVLRLQEGTLEVKLNKGVIAHQYDSYSGIATAELLLNSGLNTVTIKATNKCGDTLVTKRLVYFCIPPQVSILSPVQGLKTELASLNFEASVQHISNKNQIKIQVNGKAVPFSFSKSRISGMMNLTLGSNELTISVTNDCGTDTKNISVVYEEPCYLPIAMISEPALNQTVTRSILNFEGSVANVSSRSDVQLFLNGRPVAFRFNNANGDVLATLNLSQGTNTIRLTAVNRCGVDEEVENVVFNCPSPRVVISTPRNGTAMKSSNLSLHGTVANVSMRNQMTILINGVNVPFTLDGNGNFSVVGSLRTGQNVIVVSATTNCGTDSKTISVTYNQPCPQPFVSISSPANGSNVVSSSISLTGSAINLNAQSDMTIKLNGLVQPFSWDSRNQNFTAGMNLREGNNSIIISALTNCGEDTKDISINYTKPCAKPTVSISNPANGFNSKSPSISVFGVVTNIQSASQAQVKVNGMAVSSSFNPASGLVTANVSLGPGANTIELIASNGCGTDIATTTVMYRCPRPTVSITSPSNRNTMSSRTILLSGIANNITSQSDLSITLNGLPINFTYDVSTKVFTATMTGQVGNNSITVTATTECGTATQSTSVFYEKPCPRPTVSITSPSNRNTLSSRTIQLSGIANNITSQSDLSITFNGLPVNFTYDVSTKVYAATMTGQVGNNSIIVTATTECGTATQSVSFMYEEPCKLPEVLINFPKNGASLKSDRVSLRGIAKGITENSQLKVLLNGKVVATSFSNSTSEFIAKLILIEGKNTIRIEVENECGVDTQELGVNYELPCPKPTIQILTPASKSTAQGNRSVVTGIATNLTNASDLTIKVNGVPQPVKYNFKTQSFTSTVTLSIGAINTVVAMVSNKCGTDSKTISITSTQVQKPVLMIEYPSGDTTSINVAQSKIFGSVSGINGTSKFEIRVNGTKVTSYSLSNQGSQNYTFNGLLTLVNGVNIISVKATHVSGGVEQITKVINVAVSKSVSEPKIEKNQRGEGAKTEKNLPNRRPNKR